MLLTAHMMASVNDSPPVNPQGEATKDFHCFPDLPPELRIRIWQMAYDAIPDTLVYRFRLGFSPNPEFEPSDYEETPELQACFVPMKEVRDLTSELRSLRRVNTECRHEGEGLFDNCLRLNQNDQGGTTAFYPPISLPWDASQNFFCLVDLTEDQMADLEASSTTLIDQVLKTVRLLGIEINREFEYGFAISDEDLAEMILRFHQIEFVTLVSNLLMSEADLEDIEDETRSSYALSCWHDWVGRADDEVIGSQCEEPKISTKEDHLWVMEEFVGSMRLYGFHNPGSAERLDVVGYGMIFRTKEELDYLLLDEETLEELFAEEMLSDTSSYTSSDNMPGLELSERD